MRELKKILFISQYYPPEIGGGPARAAGLAEGLAERGLSVEVIAPFPTYLVEKNRLLSKKKLVEEQQIGKVKVFRTWVFASDRSNFAGRMLYYLSFVFTAILIVLTKATRPDAIITISPPLFTGIAGIVAKTVKRAKLIFDIGDLWPESAVQLGFLKNSVMISLAEWLERWIYRNSDALNSVTRHTAAKLRKQHPELSNIFFAPNFVNTAHIIPRARDNELAAQLKLDGKLVIGYAGNVGSAQGLQIMTRAAAYLPKSTDIVFLIIGEGIQSDLIKREIETHSLKNFYFLPPVPREEIARYLSLFDVSLIPLVKNELFSITIPSKLYECMAAQIPVIISVDGEARRIVENAKCGFFVEPDNAKMLSEVILKICERREELPAIGRNGREIAVLEYDRDAVVARLLENLQRL